MPKCFKPKFKNCRCIINCTETFTERTYNLRLRAKTCSDYKNQNTIKYLIGISTAGDISFLSDGWGGFLGRLEHEDEIIENKGFLVREELTGAGATLQSV